MDHFNGVLRMIRTTRVDSWSHFARVAGAVFCVLLVLSPVASYAVALGMSSDDLEEVPASSTEHQPFDKLVADAQPVFHASFDRDLELADDRSGTSRVWVGSLVGTPQPWDLGPQPPTFPAMTRGNSAIWLNGGSYIRFTDPADGLGESQVASDANSALDFAMGDEITIEAWVMPSVVPDGQQIYVIGKGRTARPQVAVDNQNYALRLRGANGQACVSFLFRNDANRSGVREDFHRWTSRIGFVPDEQWHHIAVTYRFGDGESLRGYIDGRPVDGDWDMGGATDAAPLVDDDELWIGSSIGGNPNCSFRGALDEIAIYRSVLTADEISARFVTTRQRAIVESTPDAGITADSVLVEIAEGLDATDPWASQPVSVMTQWEQPWLAVADLPRKYLPGAVITDRATPYVVRSRVRVQLDAGEYRFLVRAKSATRLGVDGEWVLEFPFMSKNASGHERVPDLIEPLFESMHPIPAGHREQVVSVTIDEPQQVLICLETLVGGPGVRDDLGEACVAIARGDSSVFEVVGAGANSFVLDETRWQQFLTQQSQMVADLNREARRASDEQTGEYWRRRHQFAREVVDRRRPMSTGIDVQESDPTNLIDAYLEDAWSGRDIQPLELIDDFGFLRRVTLDTVGVVPSPEEWREYFRDSPETRRERAIERLLADPRWADHWVSYWQDVLAENPGILKPELNNTGPFRFWIYESFLDNKPMDRFATELIEMRGSTYGGGPAGFRLSTQNDIPMAAKALVIGQAFLGSQMQCARCHDSPVRDVTQHQLLSMAAMMNRQPISLPDSSTVPVGPDGHRALVTVSLTPGDVISPAWPFPDMLVELETQAWLKRPGDSRDELAWLVTSPTNLRFSQVIANRIWTRWMGRGLVEPVDDFENGLQIHPDLLEALGDELVANSYDLKHLARLILNSDAYQRQVDGEQLNDSKWFAGQQPRRLTAEQMVDTLYAAVGKGFDCEQITFDPEGRRPSNTFLNLGRPQRAWEFSSLSNERDRPALALPRAQKVIDLLICFGWRDSRPNGLTERDEATQLLQPLTIANGDAVHRLCQLSDNGSLVDLCLEVRTPDELVEQLVLQILGRPPLESERTRFAAYLTPGFETRSTGAPAAPYSPFSLYRSNVSWSNHLSPEASSLVMELEATAQQGDPPTKRLTPEWRELAEDVVWVLLNSPEFRFMP